LETNKSIKLLPYIKSQKYIKKLWTILYKTKNNGKKELEKRDIVYMREKEQNGLTQELIIYIEQGTYCCGACAEPWKVILNLMHWWLALI
jgi:hypothetical protein